MKLAQPYVDNEKQLPDVDTRGRCLDSTWEESMDAASWGSNLALPPDKLCGPGIIY